MALVPTVLYEDARSVQSKSFGPHELLCACVADRTGRSGFALRQDLACMPLNGVGALLQRARKAAPLFAEAPHKLMVLVDNDRIRGHLGLRSDACRTATIAAIHAGHAFVVVLLEDNTEDLLSAVAEVLVEAPLTGKPTPLERDQRLQRAAWGSTVEQRAEMLVRCPSFGRLVDAAIAALGV